MSLSEADRPEDMSSPPNAAIHHAKAIDLGKFGAVWQRTGSESSGHCKPLTLCHFDDVTQMISCGKVMKEMDLRGAHWCGNDEM